MISLLAEMLTYTFIIRALVVGSLVALCAALLGVTLVLKRFSMIGDGLSHVGFGALSIAAAFQLAPLEVAIPVVMIAAFLLLRISQNGKIKGDAAIGLISSSSIAIGVIITSMSSGMNTDLYSYMFGSVLAMTKTDVYMSLVLSGVIFILFVFFYNRIFAITFDENFAKATGVKVGYYNMLLAALTAITIVIGMRIMGTMLISSLIIFPALTSMGIFQSYGKVMISSGIISIFCFFIGIMASFIWAIPTGPCIVVVNLGMFILFRIIGSVLRR